MVHSRYGVNRALSLVSYGMNGFQISRATGFLDRPEDPSA
jgi:hypothetical protein